MLFNLKEKTSRMPSTHCRLAHRHGECILSGTPREPEPAEPGLSSFDAPSLTDGLHYISICQSISVLSEPETDRLSQSSIVVAPRFSLPADVVDSVYPTPGTSVDHTILPHIVLKDPHLPWSRSPTHIPDGLNQNDPRIHTTWLALVVFSPDELQSTDDQVKNLLQKMPRKVKREQSETCTLRMFGRDTVNLNGVNGIVNATAFDPQLDASEAAKSTEIVLLPGKLFTDLFIGPGGPRDMLNVDEYKHMAHVRKAATDSMAGAGSEVDDALFSVVVSRRTGPIEADTPSMMTAHLLSLSWDTKMSFPEAQDRVAVTSLYSWTYTCRPSSNTRNTLERSAMLTTLGQHLTVLRTDEAAEFVLHKYSESDDVERAAELIAARQRDGYTLTRHRTVTGEVTAAILRGPLVSRRADWPQGINKPIQSNHGQDLAVFDPHLGLLDVTYSNAWQLGRKLAMADQAFCVAIARLRDSIESPAFDDYGHGPRQRPAAGGKILGHPAVAAMRLTMLAELNNIGVQGAKGQDDQVIYIKENIAASSAFASVFSWILDKVHLGGVPANYLIPDTTFLPEETLRFFHVDTYWIDALIDGALSLANHRILEPEKDTARMAIKEAVNKHLTTPDEGRHGQLPCYGLLIRSHLLVEFPDMVIDVKSSETRPRPNISTVATPTNTQSQQLILAQKRIAPNVMYVLFDAAPSGLEKATFTMPPHKRSFRIGETLTDKFLEVVVKRLDNTTETPSNAEPLEDDTPKSVKFFPDGKPASVFDWKTRTLNPAIFARHLIDEAGVKGTGSLTDEMPTSAVIALQLDESVLQLDISELQARNTVS